MFPRSIPARGGAYYREALAPAQATRVTPDTLLQDTDLCVKCGLCLPHCPTYGLAGNEAVSPRGRIALMQGLASGELLMTPAAEHNLDTCLGCRACEAVCPAQVPYGRMIDATRTHMAGHKPARLRMHRAMGAVLTRKPLRNTLAWLLWLGSAVGLVRLGRGLFGGTQLGRLASLLPPLTRPGVRAASAGTPRGRVGLFTGCVSSVTETQALRDTVDVLKRFGYSVDVPTKQACCGALASHNGMPQQADTLAQANLAAFDTDLDAIVGTASGCTANLVEYGEQLGSEPARAFARRAQNIEQFLADADWPADLRWDDSPMTVAVHTPCSLRNVLGDARASIRLLQRLPGVTVIELDGNTRCCGAAGSYFVTQPKTADALLQPKLDAALASKADVIASSNVGCAMHIGGGLRRLAESTGVVHPISLLAQRLQ